MTAETVRYYKSILNRVRKGKAPEEPEEITMELEAFDFIYSLSLYYARLHNRVKDLAWSDSMLLDCGQLAKLWAREMVTDESWEELRVLFDGYIQKRLEKLASEAPPGISPGDAIYGGFALSEYVVCKEVLECLKKYTNARRTTTRERLMETVANIILGNPLVNGRSYEEL